MQEIGVLFEKLDLYRIGHQYDIVYMCICIYCLYITYMHIYIPMCAHTRISLQLNPPKITQLFTCITSVLFK